MAYPDEPGQDTLRAMLDQLAAISTQPAFLELLQEIEAAPRAERMGAALRLATVDELRGRGIDVPPEFRISTRYFEDPSAPIRGDVLISTDEKPDGKEPPAAAPSVTVCFSAGLSICASVGTSTDIPSGPGLPPPIIHKEPIHPKHDH